MPFVRIQTGAGPFSRDQHLQLITSILMTSDGTAAAQHFIARARTNFEIIIHLTIV